MGEVADTSDVYTHMTKWRFGVMLLFTVHVDQQLGIHRNTD